MKLIVLIVSLVFSAISLVAQDINHASHQQTEYSKAIQARTSKIVSKLGISDSLKEKKVQQIIAAQYVALSTIHDAHDAKIKAIKSSGTSRDTQATRVKVIDEQSASQLARLHNRFIQDLSASLGADQVEIVKDEMTYRILPITYAAYLDMLPALTEVQKLQIYSWLVEAREAAMDAGSSEGKHAVFGKFKGRINNYLSAAGYNLKKEGEEWEKRKKAAKASVSQ